MSLKKLVNTPELHDELMVYIRNKIAILQTSLEQASEIETVYRLQGQILGLRRLLQIRDEVNKKDKQYG